MTAVRYAHLTRRSSKAIAIKIFKRLLDGPASWPEVCAAADIGTTDSTAREWKERFITEGLMERVGTDANGAAVWSLVRHV